MKEKIAVLGADEPLIPFYRQTKNLGYQIIGIAVEKGDCLSYEGKHYSLQIADKVTCGAPWKGYANCKN